MNQSLQTFWTGGELHQNQWLSYSSFLHHGHSVVLYVYDDISVPQGVTLKNAEDIIRRKKIETFLRGGGSVERFSDLFRYTLLAENGGWWFDGDMICVRPFDFSDEYVFSSEQCASSRSAAGRCMSVQPNCGVIKAPKAAPILVDLVERAETPERLFGPWGATGPILMGEMIEKHGLKSFVKEPVAFCPIHQWEIQEFILSERSFRADANTYGVHLWNHIWRHSGLDLIDYHPVQSFYSELMTRYNVENRC